MNTYKPYYSLHELHLISFKYLHGSAFLPQQYLQPGSWFRLLPHFRTGSLSDKNQSIRRLHKVMELFELIIEQNSMFHAKQSSHHQDVLGLFSMILVILPHLKTPLSHRFNYINLTFIYKCCK